MNNQETYRLIDLIRLLDHALVPERDVTLRERLSDDRELRQRLKSLQNVMAEGVPVDLPEETESILIDTEETLTAYLDGLLNDEAALEFEEVVLVSPSLLWEVISADRFTRSDAQDSSITPKRTHRAMQAVIDANVESVQQNSVNGHSSRQGLKGQPLVAKAIAAAIESEVPFENSKKVRPKKSKRNAVPQVSRKLRDRRNVRFVATASLAIVTIIGTIWFGIQNGLGEKGVVDSKSHPGGTLEVPQVPPLPPNVEDSVAVEKTPLVPHNDLTDSVNQQMPTPKIASTNSTENKSPEVPSPEPVRIIPLEWKRTTGLVVARTDQKAPWKPVTQASEILNESEEGSIEYRSLQESWGEAYAGATRIVMGPQTATRLLITQTKLTRFTIEYVKGQLAVDSLPLNAEILVEVDGRETTLRVIEPDTSIAFDSEVAAGDLIVLQGALSLHEGRIDASHKISLTEIRYTGPEEFRQKPKWIAAAPQSQAIVRSTAETFSEESNLLAALLDLNSELSDRQTMIAAEWSFELQPILAVPRAALSTNEIHREAAIGWLLSTNHPSQDQRAAWGQIAGHISASPLPVADWYVAMRRQNKVTPELLRELALGIGGNQPLFVRQSSIHMLRSISGQPFQTYQPGHPSPRAIGAVRASVRKMISRSRSPQRRTDRRP